MCRLFKRKQRKYKRMQLYSKLLYIFMLIVVCTVTPPFLLFRNALTFYLMFRAITWMDVASDLRKRALVTFTHWVFISSACLSFSLFVGSQSVFPKIILLIGDALMIELLSYRGSKFQKRFKRYLFNTSFLLFLSPATYDDAVQIVQYSFIILSIASLSVILCQRFFKRYVFYAVQNLNLDLADVLKSQLRDKDRKNDSAAAYRAQCNDILIKSNIFDIVNEDKQSDIIGLYYRMMRNVIVGNYYLMIHMRSPKVRQYDEDNAFVIRKTIVNTLSLSGKLLLVNSAEFKRRSYAIDEAVDLAIKSLESQKRSNSMLLIYEIATFCSSISRQMRDIEPLLQDL